MQGDANIIIVYGKYGCFVKTVYDYLYFLIYDLKKMQKKSTKF